MGDGDDFFPELSDFCSNRGIKYGYIPVFIGAFRKARVVGTCDPYPAETPMLAASIDLEFVETVGGGTLAFEEETQRLSPHVHLSLGERLDGAKGVTTHLFDAEVQFLLEMVEVISPAWTRPVNPDFHNLKLLSFG